MYVYQLFRCFVLVIMAKSVKSGDVKSILVRAMYDFNNDSAQNDTLTISFKAGDEWLLINKASANWWLVRPTTDPATTFYVPAAYVEIVETNHKSSKSSVPKPSKRKVNQTGLTSEDSVLKELDSVLDKADSVSSVAQSPIQNCDDKTGSDGDGDDNCYQNISDMQQKLTKIHHQNKTCKRNDSETSDYRTDSHESLDSDCVIAETKQPTEGMSSGRRGRRKRTEDVARKRVCLNNLFHYFDNWLKRMVAS